MAQTINDPLSSAAVVIGALRVKNLSKTTKRPYEEKLNDIGVEGVEKSDPFLVSSQWVDDVSNWPEVEFGQIYVYLIDSPGPYTRETTCTKAYKCGKNAGHREK